MLYPADGDDYDDDDGDGVVEEVFKEVLESGNYIDIDHDGDGGGDGNGIDNDDDIDGDGDDCGDFFSQIILSNHFHCFSPSMCLTSTEQTWRKHRRRDCQRRRTP